MGINDEFGGANSFDNLIEESGFSIKDIVANIKKLIK